MATRRSSISRATNAGTTPADVLRVLADGMEGAEDYVSGLAGAVGATLRDRNVSHLADLAGKGGGNYPFAGWQTFYNTTVAEVPNFDRAPIIPISAPAPGRRARCCSGWSSRTWPCATSRSGWRPR